MLPRWRVGKLALLKFAVRSLRAQCQAKRTHPYPVASAATPHQTSV
jgi:hypothetical protein